MSLPNISPGGSVIPTQLEADFDIFSDPSSPTSSGVVITTCGSTPHAGMMSRPTLRLNN